MPIFDQGYQHWSGELSGHAWRWLAITRHGVRVALKNRFLRLLLIIAWMPDVLLRIGERLLTWITRIWRGLFAYQIILVATPR